MTLSVWLPSFKKLFVGLLFAYSSILFILLTINFKEVPVARAMMLMGMTLFAVWVVGGGYFQTILRKKYFEKLAAVRSSPVLYFAMTATLLACVEEAIAVTITNFAPLYGVQIGQAYITASTNYFTVIFLHSVIVFIPMFVMLGFLLKRYDLSPFQGFILFGLVGVVAETLFAGPQAIINAPFWILVYGLMVYLPAHIFVQLERKRVSFFLYPFIVLMIALSAAATAWIPALLEVPKTHFAPIRIEKDATSLPA